MTRGAKNKKGERIPSFEDFARELGLGDLFPVKEEAEQSQEMKPYELEEASAATDLIEGQEEATDEASWNRHDVEWESARIASHKEKIALEGPPRKVLPVRIREARRGIIWAELLRPPLAKRRKG